MKTKPSSTSKSKPAAHKPTARAASGQKKASRQAASKTSNKNTAKLPFQPRFICDCMLVLAVVVGLGIAGWRATDRSTKVLGISTQLDTARILQGLNLERARAGLGPLTLDERLSRAAAAKGENMFADNYWAHVNPDGTEPWAFVQAAGYEYQSAGENLARDFSDEESLVAAWMASPSHRANIVNGDFRDVGLAVLDGQIDGKSVVLVVNLFAQPKTTAGSLPQTATYDQGSGALVLAGQVGPASQLVSPGRPVLTGWQLGLVLVVAAGMIGVLAKLRPKKVSPRPRRRKKSRVV